MKSFFNNSAQYTDQIITLCRGLNNLLDILKKQQHSSIKFSYFIQTYLDNSKLSYVLNYNQGYVIIGINPT